MEGMEEDERKEPSRALLAAVANAQKRLRPASQVGQLELGARALPPSQVIWPTNVGAMTLTEAQHPLSKGSGAGDLSTLLGMTAEQWPAVLTVVDAAWHIVRAFIGNRGESDTSQPPSDTMLRKHARQLRVSMRVGDDWQYVSDDHQEVKCESVHYVVQAQEVGALAAWKHAHWILDTVLCDPAAAAALCMPVLISAAPSAVDAKSFGDGVLAKVPPKQKSLGTGVLALVPPKPPPMDEVLPATAHSPSAAYWGTYLGPVYAPWAKLSRGRRRAELLAVRYMRYDGSMVQDAPAKHGSGEWECIGCRGPHAHCVNNAACRPCANPPYMTCVDGGTKLAGSVEVRMTGAECVCFGRRFPAHVKMCPACNQALVLVHSLDAKMALATVLHCEEHWPPKTRTGSASDGRQSRPASVSAVQRMNPVAATRCEACGEPRQEVPRSLGAPAGDPERLGTEVHALDLLKLQTAVSENNVPRSNSCFPLGLGACSEHVQALVAACGVILMAEYKAVVARVEVYAHKNTLRWLAGSQTFLFPAILPAAPLLLPVAGHNESTVFAATSAKLSAHTECPDQAFTQCNSPFFELCFEWDGTPQKPAVDMARAWDDIGFRDFLQRTRKGVVQQLATVLSVFSAMFDNPWTRDGADVARLVVLGSSSRGMAVRTAHEAAALDDVGYDLDVDLLLYEDRLRPRPDVEPHEGVKRAQDDLTLARNRLTHDGGGWAARNRSQLRRDVQLAEERLRQALMRVLAMQFAARDATGVTSFEHSAAHADKLAGLLRQLDNYVLGQWNSAVERVHSGTDITLNRADNGQGRSVGYKCKVGTAAHSVDIDLFPKVVIVPSTGRGKQLVSITKADDETKERGTDKGERMPVPRKKLLGSVSPLAAIGLPSQAALSVDTCAGIVAKRWKKRVRILDSAGTGSESTLPKFPSYHIGLVLSATEDAATKRRAPTLQVHVAQRIHDVLVFLQNTYSDPESTAQWRGSLTARQTAAVRTMRQDVPDAAKRKGLAKFFANAVSLITVSVVPDPGVAV